MPVGNLTPLVTRLVRFKTTAENRRALREAVDFCARYLARTAGLRVRRYMRQGKPSLVASFDHIRRPALALAGHLDVVAGPRGSFAPKVKGRRLYGRGTVDMKGGIAVYLELMRHFAKEASLPSLILMLTTDEEVGGYDGAQYLLKEHGYHPRIALLADSGLPINQIVRGEKGGLHIKVSATGVVAHASEPWTGENAIEKLFLAHERMRNLLCPGGIEKEGWIETINIGTIRGGTSTNQVPSHAEMTCDIRFTEKYTPASILAVLRQEIPFCRIKQVTHAETTTYSPQHPLRKLYARIVAQEISKRVRFAWEHGSSDGRFFLEYGTTVIVHGPTGGNVHGEHEWVDLKSLQHYFQIVKNYVEQVAAE